MLLLSRYLYSVCNNENGPKAALHGAETKSLVSKRKVFVIMKNSLSKDGDWLQGERVSLRSLKKKNFIKAVTHRSNFIIA